MIGFYWQISGDRPVTVLELIIIAAVVGLVLGILVGFKLASFYRTAKISRLSKRVLDLEDINADLAGQLRSIKFQELKQNLSDKATTVGNAAGFAGSSVKKSAVALWDKAKERFVKKEEAETKELEPSKNKEDYEL